MEKGDWYSSNNKNWLFQVGGPYSYNVTERRLINRRKLYSMVADDHFLDLSHPTIEEITLFELEYGVDLTGMFDKLKELNNA